MTNVLANLTTLECKRQTNSDEPHSSQAPTFCVDVTSMIEEQEVRHRGRRRTPEEIEQIVSEFRSGRLTQIEFCQRQGLTPSILGRYLRRLRPSSEAISDGLVAVELAVQKFDGVHAGGCGLGVWWRVGDGSSSKPALMRPPCSVWCTCWRR